MSESRLRRVLLTRPRAQSESFAALIAEDGWDLVIWPVIDIRPLLKSAPDFTGIEALIFTSARAVEALAPFPLPQLPAWCVGPATAQSAREAGFTEVIEAGGDAARLIATLREEKPGRALHVRGRDRAADVVGALRESGLEAEELIAYAAEPGGPPAPETDRLIRSKAIDVAMFFSPRTSRLFIEAAPQSWREAFSGMTAIAISEAAAAPLSGAGFRKIMVTEQPDGKAMRAILRHAP